ncbi:antibiotic biosynthesis monooxygenase [Microcoleus sp. FACHB-53]|nr:antibiotic biosynthesis monooxygenase [Microcoleus sp. FACHB-53]MBD2127366.1 antibiotic biosynthesis monooxygenase [Microcoleus sp. FACHB-1]
MTFISVTRLRVRSPLFLPLFLWNVWLTARQSTNTPGFVGGQLLRDANQTFWTITAWEEQAAMKMYRNSGAHRSVMPRIQDWCDEASVVHWLQENRTLPNWDEVHRRMVAEGFPTRLAHASPAHLQRDIPKPSSSKGLVLRPKTTPIETRNSHQGKLYEK